MINLKSSLINQKNSDLNINIPSNCCYCNSLIENEYEYSCNSCGREFERCSFTGISLLKSLRQAGNNFENTILQCIDCNNKCYFFGLFLYYDTDISEIECKYCSHLNGNKKNAFNFEIINE